MRRIPAVGFAALVVATVAAFFVTQHLKVENPLINGSPRTDPSAINPIDPHVCEDFEKQRVLFNHTRLGFYLQSRAGVVRVYVFDSDGHYVATAGGSARYVRPGLKRYVFYTWNGHTSTGALAPDGTYYFRVSLDGRTIELTKVPVQVITTPPHPAVTSVVTSSTSAGSSDARSHGMSGPAIVDPGVTTATIHFTRPSQGEYLSTRIEILRTAPSGPAHAVFSFGAKGATGRAVWNGRIHGRLAPAGTYLVGLQVRDEACNPGSFPVVNPPVPGSTPHAGITVQYLTAEPPLTPTAAGSDADVTVASGGRAYSWVLFRAGAPQVLESGSVAASGSGGGSRGTGGSSSGTGAGSSGGTGGGSSGTILHVRLPAGAAGLYSLALRSGPHRASVPLVSYAVGSNSIVRVLVVLPSLTWAGNDPVDDTGDGLPDTLATGDQILVNRPFVGGLPTDLENELGVLAALRRDHDAVQLTTDLGLVEGVGPRLAGHTGVLLDGSFTWILPSVASALHTYASGGGRVASLGSGSLRAEAALGRSRGGLVAGPAHSLSPDPFGATHGGISAPGGLITAVRDGLRIFGRALALSGFSSVEVIHPPAGATRVSEAGVAAAAPVVTGFGLGHGEVVEVGLGGFGQSLAGNVGAQGLLSRIFTLLHG